jgi:cellulose synthase/poly-beta-1,6-N-acetylglucosamine synthase-like glycosyltransferase
MRPFYFFAALLLLQSLLSLRGGFRYLRFFRRELARAQVNFAPFASVIVPCRGVDQGLRENVAALLRQDYPAYETIFVTDDADDPSLRVVNDATSEIGAGANVSARVRIAGPAHDCGQKVHNLLAAVREVAPTSELLVFVDTDARPRRDWLRSLVAPLADEGVGAATGYRWFVPTARGGLASHLRSVWNASIASALGEDSRRNFCWGGSTAIRRETFDRLNIIEEWRGALSDDYALTRALQRAALPIRFVPACLVASHEDCAWRELFEFTTRQLRITRVYAPHLWRVVLFSNLVFCAVFYGGVALALTRALRGEPFYAPLAFVLSAFALGAWKARLRLAAVEQVHAREGWRVGAASRVAHLTLWPLTGALYLYNALAAGLSRRIVWRGIAYEMKSPTETLVTARACGKKPGD